MTTNIFITSSIDISTDGRCGRKESCKESKERRIPSQQMGKNNCTRYGWPTSDNLVCINLGKTIGGYT